LLSSAKPVFLLVVSERGRVLRAEGNMTNTDHPQVVSLFLFEAVNRDKRVHFHF
jgi:hypothetical protein